MNNFHATKSCVLILLMALMCAQTAQGLECYHCVGVPLEASCSSIRTCFLPDSYCDIGYIKDAEGGEEEGSTTKKIKSQQCLSFCPIDTENKRKLAAPVNMKISCCKEDLCNAAVPTGGSTWTMAGMLLFSLGSVLLQTLL
ncbi:lymphocyte antigen 6A-2/6E-1-like [Arvicanthis niloticus]|uniref:lymphocyte antigen 6A-2/6E-1-like n=1 Tax=Arvicanthis niloticus TaxID=61156 RepID=UPI00402BDCB9